MTNRRRERRQRIAVVLAIAVSFLFLTADARATNEFTVQRDIGVVMSDSIRLSTDLYLPLSDGPFPTILIRTPYSKDQMTIFTEFFAAHGYATVIQDVRGKWDSTGDMVPFVSEREDGLATLDWVAAQPWCNGAVGMWGSSYLSYCALAAATGQHPALKTVFNIAGWLNGDKINSPGGALHWMLMLTWLLHEATQTKRSLGDFDIHELFKHIPLKETMASIGIDDPIFTNPDTLETVRYDYADVQIPIFHIVGWYDFTYPSALTVYNEVSARTPHLQKLKIGPWVHDQIWSEYTESGDEDFGERAAMGMDAINALALRWFDHVLKGVDNGVGSEPPVEVFVMGRNEWVQFDDWPPGGVKREAWHLTSGGRANTLDGDGVLARGLVSGASHDTFVFDPMNPVPTMGGANFHFFPEVLGVRDQRDIEARDDVLVYTSEPMQEDLYIVGPIEAIVYASTEAKDTDFTAKLVEVRPDGYARNVVEGVIRASYRNSLDEQELLEPGKVYELTIELGATALHVPTGHRLRVEISSSNFPKYDRNPNTGEHPWDAVEYRQTTQTIYHDEAHPSRIVLPVLARDAVGW